MNAKAMSPITNPWLQRIQHSSIYLKNIFFISMLTFGVTGMVFLWVVVTGRGGIYRPMSYSVGFYSLSDAIECGFAFKLLSHYAKGHWFAPQAVRWMRWIGILSLVRGSWNIWNNFHARWHDGFFHGVQGAPVVAQMFVYPNFIFSQLLHNLVFGCVIILIAWIMDEGRKIQEEQELTV
jgi:hypothetical protein